MYSSGRPPALNCNKWRSVSVSVCYSRYSHPSAPLSPSAPCILVRLSLQPDLLRLLCPSHPYFPSHHSRLVVRSTPVARLPQRGPSDPCHLYLRPFRLFPPHPSVHLARITRTNLSHPTPQLYPLVPVGPMDRVCQYTPSHPDTRQRRSPP